MKRIKVKIGAVIGSHIVYGIHANEHCIAKPIAPGGDYVIWNIDCDGCGVWGGEYFLDQKEAEMDYAERCFSWMDSSVFEEDDWDEEEDDEDELDRDLFEQAFRSNPYSV